jgi:hypothetical protein
MRGAPRFDGAQELTGYTGTGTDISDQREAIDVITLQQRVQ